VAERSGVLVGEVCPGNLGGKRMRAETGDGDCGLGALSALTSGPRGMREQVVGWVGLTCPAW
jgi:hypothetical protein